MYLAGTIGITALVCDFYGAVSQHIVMYLPVRAAVGTLVVFVGLLVLGALVLRALIVRLSAHLRAENLPSWIQQLGFPLGAARGLWWSTLVLWILTGIGPYFLQSVEQRSLTGQRLLQVGRPLIEQAAGWLPGHSESSVLVPSLSAAPQP